MDNGMDCLGANSINFSKVLHGVMALRINFSDFENLFGRNLSFSFAEESGVSAMANTVLRIGRARIPTKIFGEIVTKIAVLMAGLQPRRARADKGEKDEGVNASSFMSKGYGLIAVFVRGCFHNPLGFFVQNILGASPPAFDRLPPERPNPAVIRNLVSSKLRNIFPIFFGDGKILGSHSRNLLRVWVVNRAVAGVLPLRPAFLYHNV
jgi:hypothetical protein